MCVGAGIKGGQQGFREEKALGIRVFNVMALDDIIIFHHWLLARGPICHIVLAGFGKMSHSLAYTGRTQKEASENHDAEA